MHNTFIRNPSQTSVCVLEESRSVGLPEAPAEHSSESGRDLRRRRTSEPESPTGRAEEGAAACQSQSEFERIPRLGIDGCAVLPRKGEAAPLSRAAGLKSYVLESAEIAFDEVLAVDCRPLYPDDRRELRTAVPHVDPHIDMERLPVVRRRRSAADEDEWRMLPRAKPGVALKHNRRAQEVDDRPDGSCDRAGLRSSVESSLVFVLSLIHI